MSLTDDSSGGAAGVDVALAGAVLRREATAHERVQNTVTAGDTHDAHNMDS